MPTGPGQYQVVFGSTPVGANVPPGVYTLSGAGGKDIDAFTATLNVGANIVWTNKTSISGVDRSQPLTITWSGGSNPGYVLLGYSDSSTHQPSGFLCSEDAAKGSFTIPSFILSALHPTGARGVIFRTPSLIAAGGDPRYRSRVFRECQASRSPPVDTHGRT